MTMKTTWLDELVLVRALDRWLPGSIAAEAESAPPSRLHIIEQAKDRIEDELDTIRIGELAETMDLSRTEFSRVFRRVEGVSPREYKRERRIERAKELLRSNRSLSEIAFALGFADQSHFTRVFKQHTGTTPAEYRRSL